MFNLILATTMAIVISALCSVAEAVLYAVPWSYIEQLRKAGRRSGELLHELRTDVERPISAVLILNTIANTAGASIAGAAAANVFGSQVMGVFAALFTLVILLFSEILPKTIGVAYARPLSRVIARPLCWLIMVLGPLIWITGSMARLVRPANKGPHTSEADIMALASMTRRSGVIKDFEERVINNIMGLDTKTVEDIMTPRTVVFSLSDTTTAADARTQDGFWNHSRVPVYSGENPEDIVGIIHRRSIMEALANDHFTLRMSDLMRPVHFVLESLTLDRLLQQFLKSRVHLNVVLDEYGGVAGVVSLEDVLEEILGKEIVDETDAAADMQEFAREQRKKLVEKF